MNCIFLGLLLIFRLTFASADLSFLDKNNTASPVTDICLGCICEAASGCDRNAGCVVDVCGLFKITKFYWIDAGMPTLQGEDSNSANAYENCANDPYCAARAIQGYMAFFGEIDCNGDGKVDCLDFASIHRQGGYGGCKGELDLKYKNAFDDCIGYFLNNGKQ